jgi:hypothetical protein
MKEARFVVFVSPDEQVPVDLRIRDSRAIRKGELPRRFALMCVTVVHGNSP